MGNIALNYSALGHGCYVFQSYALRTDVSTSSVNYIKGLFTDLPSFTSESVVAPLVPASTSLSVISSNDVMDILST